MNLDSSSSQSQVDVSRRLGIGQRDRNFLQSHTLTSSAEAASDLWVDWRSFDPSKAISYKHAADERFEDGMEGRTSQSLNLFVVGIQKLATRLISTPSVEAASDLWTGDRFFGWPERISYESAATASHGNHELEIEVNRILSHAADERFEDGMEGRTSQSLNLFVSKYSVVGIQKLATRLASKDINQGVAAAIARILGQIEHARSHNYRIQIAERLLYSPLPLARDAGAVALTDLAAVRSIPALQTAVEAEQIPGLKTDMQASLNELIKLRDVVGSQEA